MDTADVGADPVQMLTVLLTVLQAALSAVPFLLSVAAQFLANVVSPGQVAFGSPGAAEVCIALMGAFLCGRVQVSAAALC